MEVKTPKTLIMTYAIDAGSRASAAATAGRALVLAKGAARAVSSVE